MVTCQEMLVVIHSLPGRTFSRCCVKAAVRILPSALESNAPRIKMCQEASQQPNFIVPNRAQNWAKTLGANWLLDIFF